MEVAKIHANYTDTGHWMARSNHDTGLIELNRRDFPRLSPMTQDYIWVHEWVHLIYNIYDEAQCNEIADKIFVSRAKNDSDRREREEFVKNSYGTPYSSGIAVSAVVGLVSTVISLGIKAYQIFGQAKEKGYYDLNSVDRYELLSSLINASFEAAKEGGKSAQQIFWSYIVQCPGVEPTYTEFINNQANHIARSYIAKCEVKYGFKFDAVLPVDFWSKPVVKYSVIALAVIAAVLVFVKLRKTKKI